MLSQVFSEHPIAAEERTVLQHAALLSSLAGIGPPGQCFQWRWGSPRVSWSADPNDCTGGQVAAPCVEVAQGHLARWRSSAPMRASPEPPPGSAAGSPGKVLARTLHGVAFRPRRMRGLRAVPVGLAGGLATSWHLLRCRTVLGGQGCPVPLAAHAVLSSPLSRTARCLAAMPSDGPFGPQGGELSFFQQ